MSDSPYDGPWRGAGAPGEAGIIAGVPTVAQVPVAGGGVRRLADYKVTSPAAAGAMRAEFPQVTTGRRWRVERITVISDSATATVARVLVSAPGLRDEDTAVVDVTTSGNLDIADEQQPILVRAGERLAVAWSGASAAAVGKVRIQYIEESETS